MSKHLKKIIKFEDVRDRIIEIRGHKVILEAEAYN